MRMWMVDPKIMCNQHLLGEHVECHMFLGTLKRGKSVRGFIENNCLEWNSLYIRHQQLVQEMLFRGMNHNSEINIDELNAIEVEDYVKESKVDSLASLNDLLSRCPNCRELYNRR